MIENRSVPPNTVLPHISYENIVEAISWLTRYFGFREHYRYGDPISGAQMRLGNAWIMLYSDSASNDSSSQTGRGTQCLTIFIDDVDAHFAATKSAGATIVEDLHETVYGERQYAAKDLAGHLWLFSRHARDVSPDEWGAQVAEVQSRLGLLPRPRWCYLEIPARDVGESAMFYEKVFGWSIRHRDSARPSFDDATGNVSGAWVTGRDSNREAGLLPYIWVDGIDSSLARAAAHGGEIVDSPHPDSQDSASQIATFRDVAGNLIGLYQEGAKVSIPIRPAAHAAGE